MPDAKLIELAEQQKLCDPVELRRQVERMLADPRSKRFVDDFVDQWFDLRDIDATTPDRKLYPEFNAYLRDSMLGETRAFFQQLLDQDRSVLNFVDSDFAMLNLRMAEHYGIEGVAGATFREVALPPGCHRGGVFTQASVLKVTANGTTTTPVRRGAWVLREILGQPPKPPPPNIPAVEPDVSGVITIREQLNKHRLNQACASCHSQIDPPGFALESFDVIGGWRTRYRSVGEGEPMTGRNGRKVGYMLSQPVDSAGELQSGDEFRNVDEFQPLLLKQPETIARNVVAQLVVYATGSESSFADRNAVDDIINKTRPHRFGLRSIIHEVVRSRMFRMK
jgi:hypothetical protein